ncbi:MAG: hypothetical protein AB8H47_04270 [Bacteroidia bacterium]
MKSAISFLFLFFALTFVLFSQNRGEAINGIVSFTTSQNVYVKFASTADIQIGDTLQLAGQNCLVVGSKSTTSCVCNRLSECNPEKGTAILFSPKAKATVKAQNLAPQRPSVPQAENTPEAKSEVIEEEKSREKIRGRVTLSSYNNFSATRANRNRVMARFSLDADHIKDSDFSFETYLNYRYIVPENPEAFAVPTSHFRVFNLAVRYDPRPDFTMSLGRKINPRMASLGAIDGLQVEKSFGNAYLGAIAGSRPDIGTFALNLNLLQYGGFVGIQTKQKQFYSQSTIGLIQQQNAGKTDRRYAYLQHSSTIARRLSLFGSAELDLYSAVNGVVTNQTRLTNLYASATYRLGRKANLMLSYDSRRRVLYYETFLTEIERLLSDDLARQGVRLRVNVRPIKYVNLGFSYAKRFQSDQQNKSDNIHASARWSRIPVINGRLSFTYNMNTSDYLKSDIFSARYSRNLIKNKLEADFYYRYATYLFGSSKARVQHYAGTNLSVRVNEKLNLGLSTEASFFNEETNYRAYVRLSRRISGK